jgi:hypothetical protein
MTQVRTVNLPQDLCAEAERQFEGRFDNVEALLTFVLQEITKTDAGLLDQAEEQMIEQRLKDLGYL